MNGSTSYAYGSRGGSGKTISIPNSHSPWGVHGREMLPMRGSLRYIQWRSYTLHSATIAFDGHPFNVVDHPSLGVRTHWKFRRESRPGSPYGNGTGNDVSSDLT